MGNHDTDAPLRRERHKLPHQQGGGRVVVAVCTSHQADEGIEDEQVGADPIQLGV
jgi:hypothetical protein